MLRRQRAGAGLIFIVAALGSSAGISQSLAKVATVEAGQWEIVRHFELTVNGPDYRPNPASDTTSLCFSEEYVNRDLLTDYLVQGADYASQCAVEIKSAAGGRLEVIQKCQTDDYLQTINYTGTYSATHFEVTESEAQTTKDGGNFTRRDRIVGRRTSQNCS